MVALGVWALVLTLNAGAFADDIMHPVCERILTKLGLGAVNVVTSVAEVPGAMIAVQKERGPIVGLLVGAVKGATNGVERALSGVVDIATFFIPMPKRGFKTAIVPINGDAPFDSSMSATEGR